MATHSRLLLAGSMVSMTVLLLAGCGAAPEESGTSAEQRDYKSCIVSDEGGFADKSFNENSYQGLKAAEKDYGIQIAEAESSSADQYGPHVNGMVQAGCDSIITVGFALADTTKEVAQANSDVHFAIVDDGSIELDNVRPIVYDTAQAAFQAGYLAAAQSKTGKVATYGGAQMPTVTIFMDGFAQGVDYYNKEKNADVELLGWDNKSQSGTFIGNFTDQTKGKTNTQNFLNQGADVIMPVAGPVGGGTLEAVSEHNAKNSDSAASVIWVDSDGYETNPNYQDIILTSVQKKMKEAVESTIKDDIDGQFSNQKYIGTLENGGVGLAPFHNFDDKVSAETKTELEQIKDKIISGQITVDTEGNPSSTSSS